MYGTWSQNFNANTESSRDWIKWMKLIERQQPMDSDGISYSFTLSLFVPLQLRQCIALHCVCWMPQWKIRSSSPTTQIFKGWWSSSPTRQIFKGYFHSLLILWILKGKLHAQSKCKGWIWGSSAWIIMCRMGFWGSPDF